MTDVTPQPPVPVVAPTDETRNFVIAVYALYLGALFCGGLTGIAGVILAYIKRNETRGTIWESHFENAIHAFWIWLVLFIVGVATSWLVIGFFVMGGAFIYFLYRTIKGLLRAIESKPYG